MTDIPLRPLGGPPVPVALATPKPWYQSKTMWTNLFFIAAGAASLPFTGKAAGAAAIVGGIANIGLRLLTNQPIGDPNAPTAGGN